MDAAEAAPPALEPELSPPAAAAGSLPVMLPEQVLPRANRPLPRTQCPYCKSRLSAVESKMERCLSCGAQFDPAKRATADLPSGEFIVRI